MSVLIHCKTQQLTAAERRNTSKNRSRQDANTGKETSECLLLATTLQEGTTDSESAVAL